VSSEIVSFRHAEREVDRQATGNCDRARSLLGKTLHTPAKNCRVEGAKTRRGGARTVSIDTIVRHADCTGTGR